MNQGEEEITQVQQYEKVVKYIVKNTPFGQANLVIKDLCKIIGNINPQDPIMLQALKDHNEEHLALFKGQSTQILTSVLNSQEDFYVDQKNNETIQVDHEKLEIISRSQVELPSEPDLNQLRDALEQQLNLYLSQQFNEKICGAYVMYQGDASDFTFYLGITAKTINLPNFFCGSWISTWEFTRTQLKGDLKVQAHYYEDGNVQLKNVNTFSEGINVDLSAASESAKQIVHTISKLENKHLTGMDNLYNSMPDIFFKAMRRPLPITGTKMNWNENVHKLVANLKQ
ncbi:unnamed protein product [Paramecium sonneborni]|uniref:F-actin-capping protein subunit alpha n=1 Tax=Paramecium sonneborni TaxID=65129 RepID=A0A8S1L9R0_9CILI|nr:unnamed protein product [Paramecium sonneborni]